MSLVCLADRGKRITHGVARPGAPAAKTSASASDSVPTLLSLSPLGLEDTSPNPGEPHNEKAEPHLMFFYLKYAWAIFCEWISDSGELSHRSVLIMYFQKKINL